MRLLLLSAVCCLQLSLASAAPRNIILFVADDLSPDAGCYGNQAIQTPSIDALAGEATLFTHAFATTASCSASRSVILTGLHNHSNGQYGHLHNYHKFGTHGWVQSLPALLKARGYRTARVGKFHVGPAEVYPFDEHFEASGRDPGAMVEKCHDLFADDSEEPFFLLLATADPHRGGGFADELPGRPDRFGNPPPGSKRGDGETPYQSDEVVVPPFLPDTPQSRAELAQYYQSVARVDRGLGRLMKSLRETGRWEDTLLVFTSDHGMAFAGAKTSVYEPGLRVPLLVRDPYQSNRPERTDALASLVDLAPTLLDFAGGLDRKTGGIIGSEAKKWEWRTFKKPASAGGDFETGAMRWLPYRFHGRSLLPVLAGAQPTGWDHVTASHTFHEIQMYYPMRVYRDRKYKLIWNIAHQLPYPFASDLWTSPTWQAQLAEGRQALYGQRTVEAFIHRPEFELFDIAQDPREAENLADKEEYAAVLEEYKKKLQDFQSETGDPWSLKWSYD